MYVISFDNIKVFAEPGEILLEVAKRNGIYIPSLCYLKGIDPPKERCGLCIVEIEGEGI